MEILKRKNETGQVKSCNREGQWANLSNYILDGHSWNELQVDLMGFVVYFFIIVASNHVEVDLV